LRARRRGRLRHHLAGHAGRRPGQDRRDARLVREEPPLRHPEDQLKPSSNRRSFMRAVGAGFASLPFFKLLEDSFAKGAGDTLPLRLVAVYHPHGVAAELWAMKSTDTETSFDIGYANCSLQPFDDAATYGKSFKDKILVIEGIDHLSNANGHDSAGTIL